MYQFTDTTEAPNNSGHSLMTVLNGIVLDEELSDNVGEFRTINVDGRGIVDRRILTYERKYGNAETIIGLDERLVRVTFQIRDETNEGFRQRYNRLNAFLVESRQILEFTDEEAIFYATVESYDDPEENSNNIIGVITFVCNDPFKYSHEKSLEATGTHNIKGHKSTFWKSHTTFTSSASKYILEFNTVGTKELRSINRLEINFNFVAGDILEIDFLKRQIKVNGNDISNTLSIINSNYMELPIGDVEFHATEETEITYRERYY